jgi:hypothetical protein
MLYDTNKNYKNMPSSEGTEIKDVLIEVLIDQHMHYILVSKSITPTYVSAYNRPSSGGQSFLHRLYIC